MALTRREQRVNAYTGDGLLHAQGATTRYAQDLALPLPQVLVTTGATTATSLYGADRLATVANGTRTWDIPDALGSVRLRLDDTGAPLQALRYDPWGTPQLGPQPQPFGFTGELHDPQLGLVNLRARWYDTSSGTFLQRDPYPGVAARPFSQHPYAYALASPVNYTDPSGKCLGYLWGDPTCAFIGWERVRTGDLNWQDGRPWGGAAADFTPLVGDFKGGLEVFTGCDLVTGEALGNWRWLGLLGVSELRHLRHLKALPPPHTANQLRSLLGMATGGHLLPVVTGTWLRGTQGNVGRIPGQVANKLRGQQFQNFKHFRQEFWRAVAADPDLANQFSPSNRANMAKGDAPFTIPEQQSSFFPGDSGRRYNLHHITPISQGGEVYDLDNIVIVTPRYHEEILDPDYHQLPYDPATQRGQEFRP